mgnify:CR=1 FL=1
MKKRPNATPSGPAGHSRQAFQGGTYSLMLTAAVLALLIPSMLAWQSRKHNPQANYRVAGGAPALALVFLCGIVVIAVQFSIAAGLLPEVG